MYPEVLVVRVTLEDGAIRDPEELRAALDEIIGSVDCNMGNGLIEQICLEVCNQYLEY